ncbi:putative chromatin regulator PHD family [Helianthus annuus]|nr:putative chromatin regulator PHD family [Helianthus annuus]
MDHSEEEINSMDFPIVALDSNVHNRHHHSLSLVHLQQPNHKNENADDDDDDEVDFAEEDLQCNLCKEQIWSFHLCYYSCKSCDYSLHKFCAQLPNTITNHPLHPDHTMVLKYSYGFCRCIICNLKRENYLYHCEVCKYYIDIICFSMSEHKINHPSHDHQLERMYGQKDVLLCVACGYKHEGVFFQCTACPWFRINLYCAFLPTKLLIQNHTDGIFTHPHPLTLTYSFPYSEIEAKFYPLCRVCGDEFYSHLWIYKCDKCRYYVHFDCVASKREPFMSIFRHPGLGETSKNFIEDEHPNLLHCPFQDEGDNLVKFHMSNKKELIRKHDDKMLNHFSHQHPLILFDTQSSVDKQTLSLHDPKKRIQLLCDGCVKPVTTLPFYMCCQFADGQCCFILHEWCAKLPSQVHDYVGHPEHTLSLIPKVSSKFFGVFHCPICNLPSNGFAYGCTTCEFYVDINCAFIPKDITHDAHPGHLLSIVNPAAKQSKGFCNACLLVMEDCKPGFHCPSCDFYFHVECALLLPKVIENKCDKHPLSLRYEPVQDHISEYFCEICEDELNPWKWFYHCTTCAQSMHAACMPLILQVQCEQATYKHYERCVYEFLNVKFGGTLEIKGHSHRLAFVQGRKSDGKCSKCRRTLQYKMIFKCLECEFAVDYRCASRLVG